MELIAFDMPEFGPELVPWLERHIVSMELGQLVAELAAVHNAELPADCSVTEALGKSALQQVLAHGLKTLSARLLRQLITQPYYLLDLQVIVLAKGIPYWDQRAVEHSWRRLEPKLVDTVTDSERPAKDTASTVAWATPVRPSGWYRRPWPWLLNLATAAAVFLAAYFVFRMQPAPKKPETAALVWVSPARLAEPATPEQYWHRLASVRQWWFRERPASKAELAKRLGQLSEGCSVLILSEHKSLSQTEANELVKKCRNWADKMHVLIADLEKEGANLQEIQAKADAWVNNVADKFDARLKT